MSSFKTFAMIPQSILLILFDSYLIYAADFAVYIPTDVLRDIALSRLGWQWDVPPVLGMRAAQPTSRVRPWLVRESAMAILPCQARSWPSPALEQWLSLLRLKPSLRLISESLFPAGGMWGKMQFRQKVD
ncbi:hypothetical protein QBC40DRAFT_280463 [Triangularia verruculosa]|uniref:Uncharacterized protein n=1 Tax=Triangularia verruculosa TaxID=2587418 RepID=A0AAN6XGK0_9PEZI|nr:hypothetical protein QBC40DRAFT_280463 [Triangularia verruculosa]